MARELSGSQWRAFAVASETSLSEALQEATNVVAGIELLEPFTTIRVMVKTDIDGVFEVLIITEGFKP